VIGRGTLGLAAALMLGWCLGAVMSHPRAANARSNAPAIMTGPNAAPRPAAPAHRHARRR